MAHRIHTTTSMEVIAQRKSLKSTNHRQQLLYGIRIARNDDYKGFQVLRQRGLGRAADNHHGLKLKSSDTNRKLPPSQYIYHDNWLDLAAINHLTRTLQSVTGNETKTGKSGYDGLLDVTRSMAKSYDPKQQRSLAFLALQKAFPMFLYFLVRMMIAANQSKFARSLSASFTTLFFAWLIGPSEVRESEVHGRKEKSTVHIHKCRFLEGSNCAGICINLCKYPTQIFMKSYLGMPVNMVPNFEDMSCEMIFGEEPSSEEEDPASRQPCYKICEIRKEHNKKCS